MRTLLGWKVLIVWGDHGRGVGASPYATTHSLHLGSKTQAPSCQGCSDICKSSKTSKIFVFQHRLWLYGLLFRSFNPIWKVLLIQDEQAFLRPHNIKEWGYTPTNSMPRHWRHMLGSGHVKRFAEIQDLGNWTTRSSPVDYHHKHHTDIPTNTCGNKRYFFEDIWVNINFWFESKNPGERRKGSITKAWSGFKFLKGITHTPQVFRFFHSSDQRCPKSCFGLPGNYWDGNKSGRGRNTPALKSVM